MQRCHMVPIMVVVKTYIKEQMGQPVFFNEPSQSPDDLCRNKLQRQSGLEHGVDVTRAKILGGAEKGEGGGKKRRGLVR